MHKDQTFFPGMEPLPRPERLKPPDRGLRRTVKELEERVFALEVEMTVENKLNEEARRK